MLISPFCSDMLLNSVLLPFPAMFRTDFNYRLPVDLIAQVPAKNREDSRLLYLDASSGRLSDHRFPDLVGLLDPGDLLVFNDTRVIPARLFGTKETGGRVEILVERITGEQDMLAQIRAGKSPANGTRIILDNGKTLMVTGKKAGFYKINVESEDKLIEILASTGHMPLPPYIRRADEQLDRSYR